MKKEIIKKIVKNKEVLDIGSGGSIVYNGKTDDLLIKMIKNQAKTIVCVEVDKNAADTLKKLGFNVINEDAEKVKFNKKFDVIVMGDVIEHVNNVGKLIENMKKHLKEEGKIIITTPNPFSFNNFFRILIFKNPRVQKDHTSFIALDNMKEICRRHSLEIKEVHFYTLIDKRSLRLKISSYLLYLIGKIWKWFNNYNLYIIKKINKS